MKIVLVNYRFYLSGGPEKYLFNFIASAKKRGHTIIPFSVNYDMNNKNLKSEYFIDSPMGNASEYSNFSKKTLPRLLFFLNSIYNFQARKQFRKLILKEKPDLVYVIHQSMTISPSFFSIVKKYNIKLIHRISDFNMLCCNNLLLRNDKPCERCIKGNYLNAFKYKCVKNNRLLSLYKAIVNFIHRYSGIYNSVDAFIFPSRHTLDVFSRSNYIKSKKLFYLPTFTPLNKIKPTSLTNKILIPGRVSHEKGHNVAIKAMIELNSRNIKVNFIFNGEKESIDSDSKKLIDDYNLNEQITFSGFLDPSKYEQLLASSLLVVFPAIWYENLPNTLIESYKYSKPVIASDIGSLKEFVKNDYNGFLFEPNNHIMLADKIQYYLNNSNSLSHLGINSYNTYIEKFQEDDHWNNFLKIVDMFN
jgi:glycosyltransferase involved in cell wall biosynthesis